MRIRRMMRLATFVWSAYGLFRRSRHKVRSNAKRALRRAERAI